MSRRAAGLWAWVLQRATAIYLGLLLPWLLLHFLFSPPTDADTWRAWVAQPLIGMALSLGLLSLLAHAWVGVRDIFIDYVHPLAIRLTLLGLTAFGLLACAVWGLQIIFLTRI
jgi:succinate dehydrogenase / fumarate reductase membrane anchor subunit